jgi:hypothetical protein
MESPSSVSPSPGVVSTIETTSSFLAPPPKDPNVRFHEGKRLVRNFLKRSKRPRTGWYWNFGEEWETDPAIEDSNEKLQRYWRCTICTKQTIVLASGSDHIQTHLRKIHSVRDKDSTPRSHATAVSWARSSTPSSISTEVSKSDQMEARKRYIKRRLLAWIADAHISHDQVEKKTFRAFCRALDKNYFYYVPRSHTSITTWLCLEFEQQQTHLIQSLASVQSSIHLTFDLWTSPYKSFPVIGIVAHFLTTDWVKKSALLALRRLHGTHSGENQAEIVCEIIDEYKIRSKLGYFVLDNATSNDTAVRSILQYYDLSSEYKKRRLRCLGHIINLVARAFLFGSTTEAFESTDKEEADELKELYRNWQDQGPVGKIHYLSTFVRGSDQRREYFNRQSKAQQLVPIQDNSTRWNSTYYMIRRALDLREAFDDFALHYIDRKELPNYSRLTDLDWRCLRQVCEVLVDFEDATKAVEGEATDGSRGALWESLPTFESLLLKLESYRGRYEIPLVPIIPRGRNSASQSISQLPGTNEVDKYMAYAVNNAWLKLTKYYNLTDDSPAYTAAVVLNPRYIWTFFERTWRTKPEWISHAKAQVQKLWDTYKEQHTVSESNESRASTPLVRRKRTGLDLFMESIVDDDLNSGSAENDYQKWVKRDRLKWDNSLQPFDLCTWWRDNSGQYPTLSRLARDLLAIPAMSAENERNFSSAGHLISSRRTELDMRTVEATECLRHWHLGKGVNLDTRNEHDEIEDEKQDEWEDLHDPE